MPCALALPPATACHVRRLLIHRRPRPASSAGCGARGHASLWGASRPPKARQAPPNAGLARPCAAPQAGCTLQALPSVFDGPEWTLDQIAGLAIGALLAASFFFAGKVDEFVARSQRRQLGLCEQCGGVYDPADCSEPRCPSKREGRL